MNISDIRLDTRERHCLSSTFVRPTITVITVKFPGTPNDRTLGCDRGLASKIVDQKIGKKRTNSLFHPNLSCSLGISDDKPTQRYPKGIATIGNENS